MWSQTNYSALATMNNLEILNDNYFGFLEFLLVCTLFRTILYMYDYLSSKYVL